MPNNNYRVSSSAALPIQKPLVANNIGRLVDQALGEVVRSVCGSDDVRIRQVTDPEEYAQLKSARLRMYSDRCSYFDKLIDADGSDRHDARSYLFAAYHGDNVIGTVRLTPYPFEVCNYVQPASLKIFLGPDHESRFLEFSRLVIERRSPVAGVARALIIYGGLLTSLLTDFDRYVAVARQHVKKKSFKFNIDHAALPLRIDERGDHEYELIRGSFVSDFYDLVHKHADVLVSRFHIAANSRDTY